LIWKRFDLQTLPQNFYKGHNSQNGNALESLCNSFFALSLTSHSFWECVWAMTCIGLIFNSFISSYLNDVKYFKLVKLLIVCYMKWDQKNCVIAHTKASHPFLKFYLICTMTLLLNILILGTIFDYVFN